jgi:hypothetical protein
METQEAPSPISRAERRARRDRKKRRVARVVLEVWRERNPDVLGNMVRNADNPKICNKPCCKNPRRSGWTNGKGKTLKELHDDVAEQTQLPGFWDDAFICSNCGHVMPEGDRSGDTSECSYC